MNRPVRLAILGTQGIPARYGGYETFTEEISRRLAASGEIEVTVYCPGQPGIVGPTSYAGVRLSYVTASRITGLGSILYDIRSLMASYGRHDVVYLLGYGAIPFGWIPKMGGAKFWINLDGLEWKRSKWGFAVRRYVKFAEWLCGVMADRILCDARAVQDYYQSTYRFSTPICFIPYGADLDGPGPVEAAALLPEDLLPGAYDLLVARLEPENNIVEILQGYQAHPSARQLVVVGGLEARPYVQEVRRQAGPRVRFLGGVYDRRQLAALRVSAFAAFHGHSVGGTNPSLLEAMAAGRPILAHDNPFNREVGGELLRYFSSPADIPGILQALENRSPADLDEQGTALQVRIRDAYSWDSIAAQYRDLILQADDRS